MDEKMEQALKEFFEKLTDEQKEKAKECKTMEELMNFAGKEGLELPDELLEGVAGGAHYFSVDLSKYLSKSSSAPQTSVSGGLLL